jgi:hypothetical protein
MLPEGCAGSNERGGQNREPGDRWSDVSRQHYTSVRAGRASWTKTAYDRSVYRNTAPRLQLQEAGRGTACSLQPQGGTSTHTHTHTHSLTTQVQYPGKAPTKQPHRQLVSHPAHMPCAAPPHPAMHAVPGTAALSTAQRWKQHRGKGTHTHTTTLLPAQSMPRTSHSEAARVTDGSCNSRQPPSHTTAKKPSQPDDHTGGQRQPAAAGTAAAAQGTPHDGYKRATFNQVVHFYTQLRGLRAASRKSASGEPASGSWQYSHLLLGLSWRGGQQGSGRVSRVQAGQEGMCVVQT